MNKESMWLALASLFSPTLNELDPNACKPVKKCLHCNHTHKHNNSFCSPKCCKAYKEGK